MVILISTITIVVRLIDLIVSVFSRLSLITPKTFKKSGIELIFFSKYLSVLLMNLSISFDNIFCLRMDKKLWPLVCRFVGLKKSN